MTSPREVVQDFLAGHEGFFCGDCLAAALELRSTWTTMASLGLQRDRTYEVREGPCSTCGRRRWVIRRRQELAG